MTIQIAGFSDSVKVPGFFGETVYNAGQVTAGSIPLVLLLVGTQLSTGTAVPDQDVVSVFSTGDANTAFGAGSDIALQCYGALQTPGVTIKAASVAEANGSVAATAVVVIGGLWTVGGTLNFRVDGVAYNANALSTDTATTFGATVAAAVNANGNASVTAVNAAGTVTLTRRSKGLRGNQGSVYISKALLPSGMTVQIAGGVNTTIASPSNTKALPQKSIALTATSSFPTSGQVVIPALSATVTYTGTQTATATTVAAGSDGVNVNTFVGAQTLNVGSTAGWPSSGSVYLPTVDATVTYTAVGSGTTLTGCTTLYSGAGVIHTGDAAVGTLLLGCTGGTGSLATGQVVYELVAMTGTGCRFVGGSGTESVTTVLASVVNTLQFDRIAPAQNDATNLLAWEAFVNAQAAPLVGLTEHLIFSTNGTYAAALSLAQTTLNAERAQLLWENDGETYPPFVSATFAAVRTSTEQGDPDAAYDGFVLPGVAPQSQHTDWPSTNTQIAALNNGVTPIATNANGQAYVVRSITTHSQDSTGNPQYTTLDTSQAVVPDYVRLVLKLLYLTQVKPQNPRTGPDPAATARRPPAGFLTPRLWSEQATLAVTDLENASPPILLPGSTAANPVITEWDEAGQRLMSIQPVVPCPNNHQIGVSVRNVTSV